MKDTILEFCELKNRMSEDRIIQFATDTAKTKEGEPEKIFRKFDDALLKGDKEIIQSLIVDNKKANILWKEKYLKPVAEQLNDLSFKQPIKRIYESENGENIKILASGWPFSIEMIFKNGEWKVNADEIIELRINTP